jgi:hypothetical protein
MMHDQGESLQELDLMKKLSTLYATATLWPVSLFNLM